MSFEKERKPHLMQTGTKIGKDNLTSSGGLKLLPLNITLASNEGGGVYQLSLPGDTIRKYDGVILTEEAPADLVELYLAFGETTGFKLTEQKEFFIYNYAYKTASTTGFLNFTTNMFYSVVFEDDYIHGGGKTFTSFSPSVNSIVINYAGGVRSGEARTLSFFNPPISTLKAQPTTADLTITSSVPTPTTRDRYRFTRTHDFAAQQWLSIPLMSVESGTNAAISYRFDYLRGTFLKNISVTEVGIGTSPITSSAVMLAEMKNFASISGSVGTTAFNSRNNPTAGGDIYYADTNKSFIHGTVINPTTGGGMYLNFRTATAVGPIDLDVTIDITGALLHV
jgi:hypothetical protein